VILVDANVLIYAVNGDTPHHPVANSWLAGALNGNEVVGLDWTVVLAFLRIVTNRRIFPSPLPIDQALVIVDEWVKHPNSVVVSPGEGHLGRLGGLLGESGTAANLVADAHVAAVALGMGAAVATFDADFHRFAGLKVIHLG
jgi:uncharacterized protein